MKINILHQIALLIGLYLPALLFAQHNTSLPVGTLPGNFSVSPSGAAVYTIPIETVKGVGELVPQIEITYNSQAGNGLVGWGTNISGISTITRTGRSKYYDDIAAPVSFTSIDKFMLDGKRLICISGTPGTNGAIYGMENEDYSQIKIIGSTTTYGPTYFEVKTKEGLIMRYGNLNGKLTINNKHFIWPLNYVEDKDGNHMTYTYEITDKYVYLSKISYGLNTYVNNGTANELSFSYESRFDPVSVVYPGGTKGNINKRLSKITSKIKGELYKEYVVYYDESTFSYLYSIMEKSPDGTVYNPTLLSWNFLPGYSVSQNYPTVQASNYHSNFTDQVFYGIDMNNDGHTDLVGIFPYQMQSGGMTHYYQMAQVYTTEYTADGTIKIIPSHSYLLSPDINSISFQGSKTGRASIDLEGNGKKHLIFPIYFSDQDVKQIWFEIALGYESAPCLSYDLNASSEMPVYILGDIDNDGKEEIIYIEKGHTSNQYPGRIISPTRNSNGISATDIVFSPTLSGKPLKLLLADFNADGFADLLIAHENGYRIFWNTGTTSGGCPFNESSTTTSSLFNGKCSTIEGGDFNGDGLTDLIWNEEDSSVWRMGINTGKKSFTVHELSTIDAINRTDTAKDDPYYTCIVQDFDGDGKSDVMVSYANFTYFGLKIYQYKDSYTCWYKSEGTSMKLVNKRIHGTESKTPKSTQIIPGTFSGKGYPEILHYGYGLSSAVITERWNLSSNNMDESMGRIIAITDGVKNDKILSYVSLINTPGYQTAHSSFPALDANIPLPVVNFLQEDGYKTYYEFSGAQMHLQGKGFLGFKKTTVKNNQYKTISTYGIDRTFYTPYLSTQEEYTASENKAIKKSTYTNEFISAGNKRYVTYIDTIKTTDYLNSINIVQYNSNFQYGIPKRVVKKYGNDLTETISTQLYSVDTNEKRILGLPLTISYKKEAKNSSVTDKIENTYDNNHRISQTINYTGNGNQKVHTKIYKYNDYGKITLETSLSYNSTDSIKNSYEYSPDGRDMVMHTNPLGLNTSYEYNTYGQVITSTDHKDATTSYSYDEMGKLKSILYPDGIEEITTREWDSSLKESRYKITTTRTDAPTTFTYYGRLGRELKKGTVQFDGTKIHIDYIYDSLGRPWKVSLPYIGTTASAWTISEYDNYGRVISITEPSGKDILYSYDKKKVTTTKDGISSTQTFDSKGDIVSVEDPAGTITYNLRPDGQPSSIVAPGGIKTSFGYDDYGRQTSITDPSAGIQSCDYNDAGLLSWEKDANDREISYEYDNYQRLKEIRRPEFTTVYNYNADGLLEEELSNNSTSTRYNYDNYGRIESIKEIVPDGYFLMKEYMYGSDGNLMNLSYSNSSGVIAIENYRYTNGHLSEINLNDAVTIWKLNSINSYGQPASVTTGPFDRTYDYDDYGLPTLRKAGNFQDLSYNFDPVKGNLSYRKDNKYNLQESFEYDNLNRLTGFGEHTMEYATNGNITYRSDVGDFSYETNGKPYAISGASLLDGAIPLRDQTVEYTSFKRPSRISENNYTATFTYNGSGQRTKMEVKKDGTTNELTRHYLNGCYEIDYRANGSTIERLYLGGDPYSAPAVYIKNGSSWRIYYICRDYQGSITNLANSAGAGTTNQWGYDAWGQMRNPRNNSLYEPESVPNIYLLGRGYTGHEYLPWFGLINMNARLYDPAVGRFLAPDPYVQMPDFTQSFNRYSYCLNNPLRYTDESGEWFLIDDLIVATTSFVTGYVSHGLSTGHWGKNAFAAGGGAAIMGWLSYNTMGGATAMSAWAFAGQSAANTALGYFTPSMGFSVGDFSVSFSPIAMFTGGVAKGSGFGFGGSFTASYQMGDFSLSAGIGLSSGINYMATGVTYNDGTFGVSYHQTHYGGMFSKQKTATVGLSYKNWSIRHENDLGNMGGDGGDKFRTAAIEIGYKDFFLGANVYTNDGKVKKPNSDEYDLNKKYKSKLWGANGVGAYEKGEVYQSPFYIGCRYGNGSVRVGINTPVVQDLTQNFIHKIGGFGYYKTPYGSYNNLFVQYGRYNPFSMYNF